MAVMYRRVILSLFPRRPALTPSPEPTCAPRLRAHRATVQVSCRAFSNSGVVLCEKNNRTSSPPSVQKASSESPKTTEPTEPEQREPEERLKATVNSEQKLAKNALLDMLRVMKVEVTTKRREKLMRVAPPPQEMKSTTSSESLNKDLVEAVEAAASTLPDSSQAKSDLLRMLRKHESVAPKPKKGDSPNIQKIISDMSVGHRPSGRQSLTKQIRCDDDDPDRTVDRRQKDNLGFTAELEKRRRGRVFFSRRLFIFPADEEQETDTDLAAAPSLWDVDLANRIVNVLNNHPRNGFEEMIQWTREGKMWQYPIDNEAGMDEEAGVPFHEHVFLEHHLEDGFPQQGPVRHFMELVVTGLSKNHQLSVQQKLEHIAWFREYFQQKQDVLNEAEAH